MKVVNAQKLKVIFAILLGLSVQATISASFASSSVVNWNGYYGGINAGYIGHGHKRINITSQNIQTYSPTVGGNLAIASIASGSAALSLNNNGFIGGLDIGYTHRFYDKFIVGMETDFQGIAGGNPHRSASQTAALDLGVPTGAPSTRYNIASDLVVSKNIDYLGTLRARFGYLLTPTFLFSGTGGFAYGEGTLRTSINQSVNPTIVSISQMWNTVGRYSATRVGWTVGSNFEWIVHSNWIAKLEYLYYDLGRVNDNDGNLGAVFNGVIPGLKPPTPRDPAPIPAGTPVFINSVNTTTRFDGQVIRLGLNYYFH